MRVVPRHTSSFYAVGAQEAHHAAVRRVAKLASAAKQATGIVKNLLAVREALSKELGCDAAFLFINTRLILRTGVDLTQVDGKAVEPARMADVMRALRDMGYLNGVTDA
jgi:hypothetical protein